MRHDPLTKVAHPILRGGFLTSVSVRAERFPLQVVGVLLILGAKSVLEVTLALRTLASGMRDGNSLLVSKLDAVEQIPRTGRTWPDNLQPT